MLSLLLVPFFAQNLITVHAQNCIYEAMWNSSKWIAIPFGNKLLTIIEDNNKFLQIPN